MASDARSSIRIAFTGEKIGDQMSAWLKKSGAEKEKELRQWNDIPSLASFDSELARKERPPSDTKASPSKR
jgi:hypothetical protein